MEHRYSIANKVKETKTGQVMVVMGYIGDMVDCMWIDLSTPTGTKRGTFNESELQAAVPYVDFNPDAK